MLRHRFVKRHVATALQGALGQSDLLQNAEHRIDMDLLSTVGGAENGHLLFCQAKVVNRPALHNRNSLNGFG